MMQTTTGWAKLLLTLIVLTVARGAAAQAPDPTAGWTNTARYGDYLSCQMKSLRKFGYGMYVTKMQAADGPVCSTFWLYADAPAPGCMPEIAQLWRWNEFDFEFVPYTMAPQNSYIELNGAFPSPTASFYGSTLNWASMQSGQITPDVVTWQSNLFMTDDRVFADMQHYYNRWMVNNADTNVLIATNDFNFAGAVRTTGNGYSIGGQWSTPNNLPGWQFASVWKYPLTAVKPAPSNFSMRTMTALNWWRMPHGRQLMSVNLPGYPLQQYDAVLKQPGMAGSTAPQSFTQAAMNNETYVFPGTSGLQPYTNLNTYTVVWTPQRVAFYINAGPDGTNIAGATPVEEFNIADYPSLGAAGPQAPQGRIPWVDTTFADKLGEVSINLANYVAFKAATSTSNELLTPSQLAGAGWSGYPPGTNFLGADALVRSVKFFPLVSEQSSGSHTADFDFSTTNAWVFDLGDGTWNATNFLARMAKYFGILYAQDFTKNGIGVANLRDAKSPLAVVFEPNAGGAVAADALPLMRMVCRPSDAAPQRNFFRVGTQMNTGAPINSGNPFMFVTMTINGATVGVSGASTPLAFYAPPAGHSVTGHLALYLSAYYHGSFPDYARPTAPAATADLLLATDGAGNISWQILNDASGIIVAYQSANPHLVTVSKGSAQVNDCVAQLSSTTANMTAGAGTGTVSVTMQSCQGNFVWSPSSQAGWIYIPNKASQTNSGAVTWIVDPNPYNTRTGTLTVAGQSVTVVQAGEGSACSYSIAPSGTNAVGPFHGIINVTCDRGCKWNVATHVDWIQLQDPQAFYYGAAMIQYLAFPNTGSPRTGLIDVANNTYTVVQQKAAGGQRRETLAESSAPGAACSFTLTGSNGLNFVTLDADIHFGSFDLNTDTNCAWTLASDADWLVLDPAQQSGVGPQADLAFGVFKNQGVMRGAEIWTSNPATNYSVIQEANGCSYDTLPVAFTNMAAGASYIELMVYAGNECFWYCTPDALAADWVQVVERPLWMGTGPVILYVQSNASTSARSGAIIVNNLAIPIRQQGAVRAAIPWWMLLLAD